MASSERPTYLPPLRVRADTEEREDDACPGPLPRTASNSVHSAGLSRSTSGASRARSAHTAQGSNAPRSPSAYSTTFTTGSSSGHHATSPPPPTSSTHAGGIQPSASFFHPSRPTYYTDFGPIAHLNIGNNNALNSMSMTTVVRSTSVSHHSESRPESGGSESFARASFTSEEPAHSVTGREGSGSASQPNATLGVGGLGRGFSMKKSREPLLPIGQKPKPVVPPTRPGVNASSSASKLPGMGSYGKWAEGIGSKGEEGGLSSTIAAGGRVRTSLEKFLRRTLSNDTQMAQDTSYVKDSTQPGSMEDYESRGRKSEDPYIEFKASPDMLEEDGTMNITRNRRAMTPSTVSRRQHSSVHRHGCPEFNPIPPANDPPLARTPKIDSSGRPMRKYQLHLSHNAFFLKGKLLTGGDSIWPFVFSIFLVFGLAGTWSGTTAVWWWMNESPAVAIVGAYMCLITIANMAATAFSDPGILPRNLDPDPPYPHSSTLSEDAAQVPLPRDLKVRSGVVRVKYCQTCRIYRPPRSSHCRMCDNCVDGCDHHCQWVNNCVGRRNYTSFILFLTSATLTLVLMISTAALHLVIQAHRENIGAAASLREGAGSAVVFALGVLIIWPVGGLLGYHVRLLLLNLTTIEQIRNSAHKRIVNGPAPPNPFTLGSTRRNVAEMLCRSRGMSWLSASEHASEDKRLPNPGSEVKS